MPYYLTALLLFFSSYTFADYTPDDTYFVCGYALVGIEISWKQRIQNKMDKNQKVLGATVAFDIVFLKEGKKAEYLDIKKEGSAYSDHIWLRESKYWFKLDRVNPTLHRHFAATFMKPAEYISSLDCEIVEKSYLTGMIDRHNDKIKSTMF